MKELLDHRFFHEQQGVHVELVEAGEEGEREAQADGDHKEVLKLLLRMDGNRKLHGKYKDHDAIEIVFQLYKDVPEIVAQEMVRGPAYLLMTSLHSHCSTSVFLDLWEGKLFDWWAERSRTY